MFATLNSEDVLLIRKIKGGDERAFQQLFDTYYPSMLLSANRILRDKAVSQDAAQDVFVLLWNGRSKLDEKLNLKAYLNRAVVNKALTILKKRKRNVGESEDLLRREFSKEDNSQLRIEGNELKGLINKAIDSMPEKRRLIFTLCRLEGRSHKEIAEKLNISTKTIENQMTAALKHLRAALKQFRGPCSFFLFITNAAIGASLLSVVLY